MRSDSIQAVSENQIRVVQDGNTVTDSGSSRAILRIMVDVSTSTEDIERSDVGLWSRDRRRKVNASVVSFRPSMRKNGR